MSKLLKHNAYHILGLDTSVEIKDVQRRAKEIEHRLSIGDMPEYDLDIAVSGQIRTKESVREAVQRIQNSKKKIKENFFWFRIVDDVDEQAFKSAAQGDYQNAVRLWQNASETNNTKSFFYKKNLALLLCFILLEENNKGHLRDSIATWKELTDSSKFWTQFIKDYKARDESANQDFLLEFKSKVTSDLADFYADLHEIHKDSEYITEFQAAFSTRGEKIEKSILNPAFRSINAIVESLESMKVSEDGVLDKDEKNQIKQHLDNLQSEFNKLIELGLYDDSQTKVMRDRAADALRSISLDIHNNLDDLPVAERLLTIAVQFVGTSGMKHKVQQDLDTLENNKKFIARVEPIMKLLTDKKFVEAIAFIDKLKEESSDQEFITAMDVKKKEAVTFYAVSEFAEGKKFFDANSFDSASPRFQKAASIVYDNIAIFDVEADVIDSWLENIKHNVKILTAENANEIDEVHNKMLKQLDESFDERWEQIAIKILINSYYYVGLGEAIKKKKSSDTMSSVMGWIFWIVIIIILSAIFG